MLESLKRILDRLSNFDLASWLNSITMSGYKVGLDTAQKDVGEEYPFEPDMESVVRIGMRAHALSEKALSKAKGGMAHNADKLYQEMDAAMKAGMSEKEALFQIQGRLRGLFTDSYQEWELERLARDQFLVATKEGRRAGWQKGGMKYRKWKIHLDSKTAADSKRMEGQITEIDKPYTDPLTGEKYMLAHIRPNDRCFSEGLWELPEEVVERDGLIYAKNVELDIFKGGAGSGIKGHKTAKKTDEAHKKIREYEEKIVGLYMEQALCVDGKGNILFEIFGDQNSFIVTPKQSYLSRKSKGVILTHNHPSGNPFSREDIFMAGRTGVSEIRAIGEKYTYVAKLDEGFSSKEMFGAHVKIYNKYWDQFRYMVMSGQMTANEAGMEHLDIVWKDLDSEIKTFHYQRKSNNSFSKGGKGSGIKGHRTQKKLPIEISLPEGVEDILYKYEYMESLNEKQLEGFRKEILGRVKEAKKKYAEIVQYFQGDTEFERLHREVFVNFGKVENKLESAFSEGEKKIAIDAVFHFAHVHGKYAIFGGTGEDIERALDYIRDQRVHKFVKGGKGSGVKGHRTERETKKGYQKAIREAELFEAQIKNEPYEYGRLMDKEGTVLFSTEGRNPESVYLTESHHKFLKGGKGLVFTHNHPGFGDSFSAADILTATKNNLKEIRVVSKRFLYRMKIKKKFSLEDKESIYSNIYSNLYESFQEKVYRKQITADEASVQMTHLIWENFTKLYPDDLEYSREPSKKGYGDIEKGGVGSGVKGHTTQKEQKSKLYKRVEEFEEKYRKRKMENGIYLDNDGHVLLTKKGTKNKITYYQDEQDMLLAKKPVLFSHNHPNDTSFSLADFKTSWFLNTKETRAVGPTNTFILKFKKEIPKEVHDKMVRSFEKHDRHFYYKYTDKVREKEINAYDANIAFIDESMEAFVNEFPEYLHYQKIIKIEKGGKGSGIKGHRTIKEKQERKLKTYKMIQNFENSIRDSPIEHAWIVGEDGKNILMKDGLESEVKFSSKEIEKIKEATAISDLILTHNHPNGTSFSSEDIKFAWQQGIRKVRVAGKEYDYNINLETFSVQKMEHLFNEELKGDLNYKYSFKVIAGTMNARDANIEMSNEVWERVSKKIDGIDYKRIERKE